MAKVYLNYKNSDSTLIGDVLKVKIDESFTTEINKNNTCEFDLALGTHNFKMYYQGWTENDMVGYLDENVNIVNDTYLIYQSPKTIYGKGKLINKPFKSKEEFDKYLSKKRMVATIIGVILLVIAILVWIFL